MKGLFSFVLGGAIVFALTMCQSEGQEVLSSTDAIVSQITSHLTSEYSATVTHPEDDIMHSRSIDCPPGNNTAGCTGPSSFSMPITVDGCEFIVTANFRICFAGIRVIGIIVEDMTWVPANTQACTDLFEEIDVLPPSQKQAALDDLHAQLSLLLEQSLVNSVLINVVAIPCGSPNANVTTSFFERDCRAWCLDGTDVGGGGFQLSYVPCGSSCCERKSEYCIDPAGNLVTITSNVERVGEIEQCTAPQSGCLVDVDLRCTNPCARLD